MNSHAEIQRRLPAYCGGDAEPAERQLIERHLAECPACRAELADLQTALRLIRSTPEIDPPTWMTARIMSRIRTGQVDKRSWLQRMFFPLHIKLPLEAIALLMVCGSGYYLSRSVESNLRQSGKQPGQEILQLQAPIPPQSPEQQAPGSGKAGQPAIPLRQSAPPSAVVPKATPPPEDLPAVTSPHSPVTPAPAPYAPPPPSYRNQYDGTTESKKTEPAAEPSIHSRQAMPENKSKDIRNLERHGNAPARATADSAAGAPEGAALPQTLVRLNVDSPSAATAMIREALLRSGGTISNETKLPVRHFRARIPAARQTELLERLERLGKIVERPAAPAADIRQLEITIQW